MKKDWFYDALAMIICSFVAIAMMYLMSSCGTTKTVVVKEVRHDTLTSVRLNHDSIYIHDSVYAEVLMRGDTIYKTLIKFRDFWREKITYDTVRIVKCDSIPVPYEKIVAVRQMYWWQKCLCYAGLMTLAAASVQIYILIRRRKP